MFEVPAAVGDSDNLHPCLEHAEGYRDPALESDGPEALENVVASGAAFREIRQRQAGIPYPPHVGDGTFGPLSPAI